VAAVSFLLWTPPLPHEQSWINGVYIFVMVQLFFILWSTLANPYMSLLPEMTTDLKERVDISAMQAVFLMIGTLVFGFLGPIKEAFGWIGIGAVLFIATIVSFLPTILTIKQRPSDEKRGAQERFRS
jgi:Na+/melibiose symporter-like transporter